MTTSHGGKGGIGGTTVMDRASSINQSSSARSRPPVVTHSHEHTKKRASSGGLSELSKQLRVMQAKNQQHEVEIDRLERQLKILADLQGISVADLRSALQAACESEAHGELQHRVASLRAQLEAAILVKTTQKFEEGASEAHVANLQLRVGELEEIEETLRKELRSLYDKLKEQTTKATKLEATCEIQNDEIEKLKEVSIQSIPAPAPLPSSQALVPVQTSMPYATMSPTDILLLTGEARTAKAEAKMERDKAALAEQQLEAREAELKLKTAQYKARFLVQDERINDLEQQLSSLYTAFELLRQEHHHEEQKRVSLEENLHNADAQVARDLEMQASVRRTLVAPVESTQLQSNQASKSPPAAAQPRAVTRSPSTPMSQRATGGKSSSAVSAASSSSSPSSPRENQLVLGGSLMVRSNDVLKRWKKRYVALYRGFSGYTLTMTDGSRAVIGKTYNLQVGISCARQNKQFAPKYPFALVLHVDPHDREAPVIHVATSGEKALKTWLSELRKALGIPRSTRGAARTASLEQQEASDLKEALRLSTQEQ